MIGGLIMSNGNGTWFHQVEENHFMMLFAAGCEKPFLHKDQALDGKGASGFFAAFAEHSFFAVSALGCNPVGSSLPRGVSPMRVEDPFIWLLNREGLR